MGVGLGHYPALPGLGRLGICVRKSLFLLLPNFSLLVYASETPHARSVLRFEVTELGTSSNCLNVTAEIYQPRMPAAAHNGTR